MDIRLSPYPGGHADLEWDGSDFVLEEGLTNFVLVSLYSNGLAPPEDLEEGYPRGGWWGTPPGVEWGSQCHRAFRQKLTTATLRDLADWAKTSLDWLLEEDIASRVIVQTQRIDEHVAELVVTLERGSSQRWQTAWDKQPEEVTERFGSAVLRLKAAG